MKVLWYSHVSMKKDENGKFFYPGGNWIISLKELFFNDNNVELGIVSWGDSDLNFEDDYGIKHYQIGSDNTSKLLNYYNNWKHRIGTEQQVNKLLFPIQDFAPDIIHIFGTETVLGEIAKHTKVPVVIHLQGIINPCLNAWHIPNFTNISLFKSLNLRFFVLGLGFFHDYFRFKKKRLLLN